MHPQEAYPKSSPFSCAEGRTFNKTGRKCAFCDLPATASRSSDSSMRDAPSELRETRRWRSAQQRKKKKMAVVTRDLEGGGTRHAVHHDQAFEFVV